MRTCPIKKARTLLQTRCRPSKWRARRDLNPRPTAPEADALSAELRARCGFDYSNQWKCIQGMAPKVRRGRVSTGHDHRFPRASARLRGQSHRPDHTARGRNAWLAWRHLCARCGRPARFLTGPPPGDRLAGGPAPPPWQRAPVARLGRRARTEWGVRVQRGDWDISLRSAHSRPGAHRGLLTPHRTRAVMVARDDDVPAPTCPYCGEPAEPLGTCKIVCRSCQCLIGTCGD